MSIDKLSCGIVLVLGEPPQCRTLMLRAWHHWDFPKGIREQGEQPMQAAIRELGEETGIADAEFDWGDRYFETGPYSRGKCARYFLARTQTEEVVLGPSPDTGEPEHHDWRWVSFDEAFDLGSPRVREVVRWARQIVGC